MAFKKLEAAWNARTPVYLHNGTKENFIFQLVLTVLLVGGMIAKDSYDQRKARRRLYLVECDPPQ